MTADRPITPLLDQLSCPSDMESLTDAQLQDLADEVRAETIAAVAETGGHLGAGLGVVELTVALHAVFDTPRDTLIWDVSHQTYPHKILTGRRDRMRGLRMKGGISGFAKRAESPFDPFGAGHAGTSISAALGFAIARDLGDEKGHIVAVIGDGALSAGMAYEALNHAGHLSSRLIVILNDNGMSIAPPVGAMATHLTALSDGAGQATNIFTDLGFSYAGPVDGHDMTAVLAVLRAAQAAPAGPTLIHVVTQKGKGFAPAEAASDKGHATGKFNVKTGIPEKTQPQAPSYTSVFADTLIDLAGQDDKICAITAAMPDGTGLNRFEVAFPDRCFDVGIAEQHAVTFAAGLAAAGMKPFCALYATFLQRGFDQVVHDVAIQGLPVRFAIDRAGLVGADGPTHAGAFDIAFLANLPGFVVMAAADEAELARMVATAAAYDDGPIAFRYPRGAGFGVSVDADPQPLKIGQGSIVREGTEVAILSFGARLNEVEAACDLLRSDGITPTVADARFAKPLDRALILSLAQDHRALITIEEGASGGFGAHVADLLAEAGVFDAGLAFRSMTLPDRFIDQASLREMYGMAGLNAEDIANKVRGVLG